MSDCLFCKIANGHIPTDFIYEDDEILVFKDINPQAPIHFLLIPRQHIESAADINKDNSYLVGKIFEVSNKIAKENKLDSGYRIVNNCREDGGQTVDHIHFHLMAGRQMLWPPG